MYKTTTSLELHRLDRPSLQNPQKIFQSDEDSTTKSDAGEHHSAAPPVTSPLVTGTQYEFYPDLYMDMGSHRDPDSCCNGQVSMQPRPVSMDIVKRRSDISLVEDTYVLDPEEKMALGLPSLDRLPAFGSNFFLQLVTHVPPNSSPFNSPRSRTPLRSSAFSVESAEIQTAKKGVQPTHYEDVQ
ncbi:hypothetical protein PENSUB_2359 [Penicillium subrubescens]|uniref:Uncharacterized protein n=1 Tax=Penicillium subrubescens TaxID=1316194 RepID=A0A1Q5UHY7_9EURO|nr:hypothetical protein PENSUB_2359 [Penicillium subrubescens]